MFVEEGKSLRVVFVVRGAQGLPSVRPSHLVVLPMPLQEMLNGDQYVTRYTLKRGLHAAGLLTRRS